MDDYKEFEEPYNFSKTSKTPMEKVRDDIKLLQEELFIIKGELEGIRSDLSLIINTNFMNRSSTGNEGVPTHQPTNTPSFNTPPFPVENKHSEIPYISAYLPAHNPTHPQHINEKPQHTEPRTNQITPEMVEEILAREYQKEARHGTNKQTNQETRLFDQDIKEIRKDLRNEQAEHRIDALSGLTNIMNALKSDLKTKFKSLTGQEFYIFSVLYTIEKSQETVTYSDIAKRTNLTASSIRDYIQRIIRKGIPITKEKLNNKTTLLKVPIELRSLATLDNLMRLRNDIPDESLDRFSHKK